jgi:hypothetical protein
VVAITATEVSSQQSAAVALGVQHKGVVVRRLRGADRPERQVFAMMRPALTGTVGVQALISALHDEAGAPATR